MPCSHDPGGPIGERIARVEDRLDSLTTSVERLTRAIYGNGQIGLITQLELLRQSVEAHHTSVTELRKQSRGDWKWIASSVIAIAAVVVALIK